MFRIKGWPDQGLCRVSFVRDFDLKLSLGGLARCFAQGDVDLTEGERSARARAPCARGCQPDNSAFLPNRRCCMELALPTICPYP